MPVAIPEDLIPLCPFPTEGDVRCAWFATVHESVLYSGPTSAPVESYSIDDWSLNVRHFFYCGFFTDEEFASHVCALMQGKLSNLPGAHRAAVGNMKLEEAEALGVPVGMGCWNPRCRRVAPVVLPKGHPERSSSDRQGQTRFKSCKACRCAHYCSRECQTADWPRHKNNCTDVGRAFSVDRRREIHENQKVHTPFGFATTYDFCLWAHMLGRKHREYDAGTPDAPVRILRRPRRAHA